MTGGFANRLTFTGWAFSGGRIREAVPPPGFAADEPRDGSGDVEVAGAALLSLVAGVAGVAEVSADCAHEGNT